MILVTLEETSVQKYLSGIGIGIVKLKNLKTSTRSQKMYLKIYIKSESKTFSISMSGKFII